MILSVMLMLILGTLDLGIATYQFNTLSQAARQGARQAAVHGSLANATNGVWGPATVTGNAGDGSVYASAVSGMLVGFNLSNVTYEIQWIDGSNLAGKRVQYSVTSTYTPIIASYFSNSTISQSAVSTMPIAH